MKPESQASLASSLLRTPGSYKPESGLSVLNEVFFSTLLTSEE